MRAYVSLAVAASSIALATVLSPCALFAASVAWDPPTIVDAGGDIANSLSIDFDSAKRPHISYVDYSAGNILRYAYFDGAMWQVESFHGIRATTAQTKTSIRVDAAGYPHIVLAGGPGPDYVAKDASGWHFEDIDNIYYSPSLRIGSDGRRHVAYWTYTGGPVEKSYRYAVRTAGVWAKETVASIESQIGECSLALDSSDEPTVAYINQATLDMCYAYKLAGAWVLITLDGGSDDTGRCNDVEIDSSGERHIVYSDLTNHRVIHAYHTSSPVAWHWETVVEGVDALRLDTDISPGGSIGTGFATSDSLFYCRKPTTGWFHASAPYEGVELAFAFDGSGAPHFATARNTTGVAAFYDTRLFYTSYAGGVFVDEVVDDGGQVPYLGVGGSSNGEWAIYGVGRFWGDMVTRTGRLPSNLVVAGGYGGSYADIEPKPYGGMYATYYGGDPQGTWFAESTSTPTGAASWTHTLICDGACTVGSTLAVDPLSGEPRLVYITDPTNGDLKYAWRDASGWHHWTLEVTGIGLYASLALNALGYARIAYYDKFNGNLSFANQYGLAEFLWSIEDVDTSDNVGMRCAIAVDELDEPHIAYLDYTNGDLKYAKKHDGSWTIQTLDTASAGWSTGIAVDSQRRPHIAYYGGGFLKYAWHTGTAWSYSIIAPNMSASDTVPVSIIGNRITIYYGDAMLGAVMKVQGWFDRTPPSQPVVEDDGDWTTSSNQLHARWSSDDPDTGIAEYSYAIGASPTPSGSYIVNWTSTGTNTEVTHTDLSLQNGAVYYFYVKARNKAGEWTEAGVSDGIRVVKLVSRISDAKTLPDGYWVTLNGKVISRDSTPYYFMMQEPNRSCGITVYAAKGDMPFYQALLSGFSVMVVGRMGHISDRRCILNPAMVRPTTFVGKPRALAMVNQRVGGGPFCYSVGPPEVGERGCKWSWGLNNIGLLVCTTGRVSSVVSEPKEAYFTIRDGSMPKDLKITVEPSWSMPKRGDYIRVEGHAELEALVLSSPHGWNAY